MNGMGCIFFLDRMRKNTGHQVDYQDADHISSVTRSHLSPLDITPILLARASVNITHSRTNTVPSHPLGRGGS